MSKPTIRELLDHALRFGYGYELAERVDAVLKLAQLKQQESHLVREFKQAVLGALDGEQP